MTELRFVIIAIFVLIPLVALRWTWNHHTQRKRITRRVALGIVGGWVVAAFISGLLQINDLSAISRLDNKIDTLAQEKATALQGDTELLKERDALAERTLILQSQIEEQQTQLDEAEARVASLQSELGEAQLGLTMKFDYDGTRHVTTAPGRVKIEKGPEAAAYVQMVELQEQEKWSELIGLCQKWIEEAPDWLTPYLFAGVAHVKLGETQRTRALELLEHVAERAASDPSYGPALVLLEQVKKASGGSLSP